MNIESIFRLTGISKNRETRKNLSNLNKFLKSKIGTGIGLLISVVIVYLIVTLFTIYNLLVGL